MLKALSLLTGIIMIISIVTILLIFMIHPGFFVVDDFVSVAQIYLNSKSNGVHIIIHLFRVDEIRCGETLASI